MGPANRVRPAFLIAYQLNLAPEIQEAILFLPAEDSRRDPVKEWQVRPIAAESDWGRQRKLWKTLQRAIRPP